MDVGEQIKARREEAGMTQKELAIEIWDKAELQKTISQWENGVRGISADSLEKVSDALGCSMDDLI